MAFLVSSCSGLISIASNANMRASLKPAGRAGGVLGYDSKPLRDLMSFAEFRQLATEHAVESLDDTFVSGAIENGSEKSRGHRLNLAYVIVAVRCRLRCLFQKVLNVGFFVFQRVCGGRGYPGAAPRAGTRVPEGGEKREQFRQMCTTMRRTETIIH